MATRSTGQSGPQFVRYFGPLLNALRTSGGSAVPGEVVEQIARDLAIPEAIQNELLPSGQLRFPNQVAWARFYLAREGLLDASRRGVWSLTEKGRATTLTPEKALDLFQRWSRTFAQERKAREGETTEPEEHVAPAAAVPAAALGYRDALLELLLALPASGFERLCQRLLRESGFIQVIVSGRSGDGGIDGHGTLEINPLVSFKVLFQCKRYQGSVSAPQVRDFRGAMQGRADKGIIMTTGSFTADARREASRDGVPPIELVDGQKLLDMFAKLELGLRPVPAYELDDQFFDEFKK